MRKWKMNSLYENLLSSFADLNQMKQIVNNAFKREFDAIDQYGHSAVLGDVVSREAFLFNNPFSGRREKYASRTTTIEELKKLTFWHKNSQYCWLLMSAYEKFEQHLKLVYIEDSQIIRQNKKLDLNRMLCHFSEKYSSIKQRESKNDSGLNLRILIHLIEKMRHAIAHNQGLVPDSNKFFQKIRKDCGIAINCNSYDEFFSQFIVDGKIYILEVPIKSDSRLNLYCDQYTRLVSYLIAYAYLIKDAAIQ